MAPFHHAAHFTGECVHIITYIDTAPELHGWRIDFKTTEVGNFAWSKLSLCVSLPLVLILCECENSLINHHICCEIISPPISSFCIFIETETSTFSADCEHVVYTNTSAHRNELKPTNTCRWKESISCLISRAQQSIFFLWHLRKLDTTQPIPVQYFWGDNKASWRSVWLALVLLPRTNCSTFCVLPTAERVIGCQPLPIKELPSTRGEKKGREDSLQPGPPRLLPAAKGRNE